MAFVVQDSEGVYHKLEQFQEEVIRLREQLSDRDARIEELEAVQGEVWAHQLLQLFPISIASSQVATLDGMLLF